MPVKIIFYLLDPPYKELGCFEDDDADDFKLSFSGISASQTPETCIYYCYNMGYRYAGKYTC